MMDINELKKRSNELKKKTLQIKESSAKTIEEMENIINETRRVQNIAKNSQEFLEDLDRNFAEQTKLNKTDFTFLFFATALQVFRQYYFSPDKQRFKKDIDASNKMKKFVPISLMGPVPYDAFKKDNFDKNTGISGVNHRYTTLGHEPLLGWIFGTLNILTETVTKNNLLLESYNAVLVGNEYKINSSTLFTQIFSDSYQRITEKPADLALAVAKHAIHLGTDAFTKQGLPLPILNNIDPRISAFLIKNNIDFYGVSKAMSLSIMINSLIAAIHGLFYNENIHKDPKIYAVKTRKILLYSNLIATTSNVVFTSLSVYAGNDGALKKLDIGGLMVTMYRLINDLDFIREIKNEFVFGQFKNMIRNN